ncbi:MAG: pyridoxal-phosphate dependent enzyme [Firmicutes bacterium]|nr:pyridoxal-phosphate dependent enzyme [Bacillota bacterium]
MRETRAFKVRGATNFIVALSPEEHQQGVVTASGGSHAVGVACAANRLGIPATLVLTERSPRHLRAICASYGAEVMVQGQVYNDAAAVAEEISRKTGRRIHSYDDPFIIAGQGTVGLEIMEDLPDVEAVMVPVGGGGLLAGVGCAVKALRPQAEVIGVEPQQAAAMAASLREGRQVWLEDPRSLADRLVVKAVGALNLAMAQQYADRVVTVSEEAIARAICTLLDKASLLAEGAAAAALAALEAQRDALQGRKVVLILTGGNIDPQVLAGVLSQCVAT